MFMLDFRILQVIGHGSFGRVEKAQYLRDRSIVCIKTQEFHDNSEILKILQQESDILFSLYHPNIVKYVKSFAERGRFYIVMEYVEGQDLGTCLSKNGPLNEQQALYYFIQLVSALKYCHDNQILHRDVKPQNILITSNNQLKLADFGISRNVEHAAKTLIGTPFYMAPEIFSNQPYSFPVDIWSLGCVLYEMVTCRKPFGNNPMLFLPNVLHQPPFPIEGNISNNLQYLIFSMLNKNPSERITLDQIQNVAFVKQFSQQFFPHFQQQIIPPQHPISSPSQSFSQSHFYQEQYFHPNPISQYLNHQSNINQVDNRQQRFQQFENVHLHYSKQNYQPNIQNSISQSHIFEPHVPQQTNNEMNRQPQFFQPKISNSSYQQFNQNPIQKQYQNPQSQYIQSSSSQQSSYHQNPHFLPSYSD
jgi:NIMA (never in mitosis gene a)-related kinase